MQSKKEIEDSYLQGCPWDYETNPEDAKRKKIILSRLEKYGPFMRALDVGCAECFITRDLPANEIHGYEISDNAASRFPSNVQRVLKPDGGYDLVIATGIFYGHYDCDSFLRLVKKHASQIFLTCNIKEWEIKGLDQFNSKIIHEEYFPYREYTQHLRIIDFGR
jgi:hypothetical protein